MKNGLEGQKLYIEWVSVCPNLYVSQKSVLNLELLYSINFLCCSMSILLVIYRFILHKINSNTHIIYANNIRLYYNIKNIYTKRNNIFLLIFQQNHIIFANRKIYSSLSENIPTCFMVKKKIYSSLSENIPSCFSMTVKYTPSYMIIYHIPYYNGSDLLLVIIKQTHMICSKRKIFLLIWN